MNPAHSLICKYNREGKGYRPRLLKGYLDRPRRFEDHVNSRIIDRIIQSNADIHPSVRIPSSSSSSSPQSTQQVIRQVNFLFAPPRICREPQQHLRYIYTTRTALRRGANRTKVLTTRHLQLVLGNTLIMHSHPLEVHRRPGFITLFCAGLRDATQSKTR